MLAKIFSWCLTTKAAKLGGSVIGGGGIIALFLAFQTDYKERIDKIEFKNERYSELLLKPVYVEINYLKKDIKETKIMVKDIHKYLLKTK